VLKKGVTDFIKLAFIVSLVTAVPLGCGAGSEIQQEQQEDMIDEREDEELNDPGTEIRQEQMEDQIDEQEDDQ
jgi:hypothetical protein